MDKNSPFLQLRHCYCPLPQCYNEAEKICKNVSETIGPVVLMYEVEIIENMDDEDKIIEKNINDTDISRKNMQSTYQKYNIPTGNDLSAELANIDKLRQYESDLYQKLDAKANIFVEEKKYRLAKYVLELQSSLGGNKNAIKSRSRSFLNRNGSIEANLKLHHIVPS